MILPLLFGAVLCYPAFLIVDQFVLALGVEPDAPLNEQTNGGIAAIVIGAGVLAGFIVGYIVGFFVNALVCRFAFSWPRDEVIAVFIR